MLYKQNRQAGAAARFDAAQATMFFAPERLPRFFSRRMSILRGLVRRLD
jgi:hypothetical protein